MQVDKMILLSTCPFFCPLVHFFVHPVDKYAYHGTTIPRPQKGKKNPNKTPLPKNMDFLLTWTFQYVNEFLSSGNDQGMESILKFSNFSEIFEKRAWRTHNAPKPANEDFENNAKIWRFH